METDISEYLSSRLFHYSTQNKYTQSWVIPLVNPLQPGVAYLYPQKTSSFQGGIDKQHRAVMG